MSALTKKAITASFMKLLNNRPLDKITVKDIVEDCGVNRNTFYYYYQDIYALLEEIFETETQAVINKHKPHDSWLEGFMESAKFAMENKHAVFHVFNSINRNQLDRYLNAIIEDYVEDFVKRKAAGVDATDEQIKLVSLFYKHAIIGIVMEWIQNGMSESYKELIEKLAKLMDGSVKLILSAQNNS